MFRKLLLGLVLGCAIGGAHAQTPSVADVGVVKGTPDIFKLLDHSGAWATFGYVDPTTHIFTPTGGAGGGSTVNGIAGVNNFTFTGSGVSVTGTTPNATVTIPGGGGGGSLSVTDGTHTVAGTTSLTFSGATVSGSTPNATATITGGGGGAIVVGSTPITGGVNGNCVYDNSGVAGTVACGGGGGGAGGTLFSTHASLVAGATSVMGTVSQQGYHTAGDGGAATYNWNASSYCGAGTSAAPGNADMNVCILVAGQAASTAGRFILQYTNYIDVRQVGMQASTTSTLFDNSPYNAALIAAQGPPVAQVFSGTGVKFPQVPGQVTTAYYFSQAFESSRNGRISCDRSGQVQSTYLAFAPGADGIIQDTVDASPDGGTATGQDIDGCRIQGNGYGTGFITTGSTAVTGVSMNGWAPSVAGGNNTVPATVWEVGDGVFGVPYQWWAEPNFVGSLLSVPPGDYTTAVTTTSGVTTGLTLAQPVIEPTLANGYSPHRPDWEMAMNRLPVELTYNINIPGPVAVTASAAWVGGATTITVPSCAGISPMETVIDLSYGPRTELGYVASCSGTTLTFLTTLSPSVGAHDLLSVRGYIATMTGGPQVLLMPGDYLWTDAFPFGAQVVEAWNNVTNTASATWTNSTTISLSSPCPHATAYPFDDVATAQHAFVMDTTSNTALGEIASCSGSTLTLYQASSGVSGHSLAIPVYSVFLGPATAGGHQSIAIGNRTEIIRSDYFTASVGHTGGTGKMWKLPNGISRRITGYAHHNIIDGFTFGISLGMSAGSFPGGGGNQWQNQENVFFQDMIGSNTTGDNSGAGTSIANLYGGNHLFDIVEGGTVGNVYVGDNTNSAEGSYAPGYGQVGECGTLNFTSFVGMYASSAGGRYCLPNDGTLGAPPDTGTIGNANLNIAPVQGAVADQNAITSGGLSGFWEADGIGTAPLVNATIATPSGTNIAINGALWWFPGSYITDLDQQLVSATRATAGSGGGSGSCTVTVQGGFLQPYSFLYFSASVSGSTVTFNYYSPFPMLAVGEQFTVTGSANSSYNTTYTVVTSSPTAITATAAVTPVGTDSVATINAKGPPTQLSTTLSAGGLGSTLTTVLYGNYIPDAGSPYRSSIPVSPAPVVGTGTCSGLTGATVNVTYGTPIPFGAQITSLAPNLGSVTISAPVTGAGVQIGDVIRVSTTTTPGSYGGCVSFNGGYYSRTGMFYDTTCAQQTGLAFQYNGVWTGWAYTPTNAGNSMEVLANANQYSGYTANGASHPVYPDGIMLDYAFENTPGKERLLDEGSSAATEAWHLQGDTRINAVPVAGGNMAWSNASVGSTTLSAAVTSGVTTTVAVAACPSPLPAAGTPIVDATPQLSLPLGTLNTCSAGSLSFQAAASNNAANGDAIVFLQQLPAALVANDAAGTTWTLGNYMKLTPVTIASLNANAPCNSGRAGMFSVVNNGASPTYGGAVGTTGAITAPVFCNGSGWTYH